MCGAQPSGSFTSISCPHAPTHQFMSTETPYPTLTIVMAPSYRPSTSCWSIAFFVLLLSPFCLAFRSVSLLPSPPLHSPLLASPQLSTLSLCLPQNLLYSPPSSFLPITLCPETCISSPLLPFLSISARNCNIAPFCLSLQPPLNPSHSATCNSSLIPAHCPHLLFPHISLSVPATLSLPCRNTLHLSI